MVENTPILSTAIGNRTLIRQSLLLYVSLVFKNRNRAFSPKSVCALLRRKERKKRHKKPGFESIKTEKALTNWPPAKAVMICANVAQAWVIFTPRYSWRPICDSTPQP